MRFTANCVMNAQGFILEAKDVILSLYNCIMPLYIYMGKFYVRCEVITGYPSGDSRENVNEIHSQLFHNLQEYPFEAKHVILSLYKTTWCAYLWAFYVQWKARNSILASFPGSPR